MKQVKMFFLVAAIACLSVVKMNASDKTGKAEDVMNKAATFQSLDENAIAQIKAEILTLPTSERIKLAKMAIKQVEDAKSIGAIEGAKAGLYVLAVFLPPIAVGIHTSWGMPTVWNVLWCFVGGVPGIIHAFIVLSK